MLPCHLLFFFNDTATTEIYTLSLHDALPISGKSRALSATGTILMSSSRAARSLPAVTAFAEDINIVRSEEHTSELQSPDHLVCRLLLEKKKLKHIYERCYMYSWRMYQHQ